MPRLPCLTPTAPDHGRRVPSHKEPSSGSLSLCEMHMVICDSEPASACLLALEKTNHVSNTLLGASERNLG